jgi:Uma2 family endonuclease
LSGRGSATPDARARDHVRLAMAREVLRRRPMTAGYSRSMQAAMIHESFVEGRRALGQDRFDEVWDGVLYMVPPPTGRRAAAGMSLLRALLPIADSLGLDVFYGAGLFDPHVPGYEDYRVPDLAVFDRRHRSDRGIEGAAHLVIEILSPRDASREKLPFYARVGVREVWLVDPALPSVEVHVCAPDGTTLAQRADARGRIAAPALELEVEPTGPALRVHHGDAIYVVELG